LDDNISPWNNFSTDFGVKKATSIQPKDGADLNRLATLAGPQFQGGILLYSGNNTLPLAVKNCFAVPINELWK